MRIFINTVAPNLNEGGKMAAKCKTCGSEMLRATVDCGTIKGSGFPRIYGRALICPKAIKMVNTPLMPTGVVYCQHEEPKVEATSKPKDVVTVDL